MHTQTPKHSGAEPDAPCGGRKGWLEVEIAESIALSKEAGIRPGDKEEVLADGSERETRHPPFHNPEASSGLKEQPQTSGVPEAPCVLASMPLQVESGPYRGLPRTNPPVSKQPLS